MSPFEVIRTCIELTFLSPAVLWVLYFLLMQLKRSHLDNKWKTWEYMYAGPLVLAFYWLDVYVNYTIMSLFLWEFPKSWKEEKLVTERLTRYYFDKDGWRKQVTAWIGPLLLDPWDPNGKHVGYKPPEGK